VEKYVLPSIMPNIFQRLLFDRNLSNLVESGVSFRSHLEVLNPPQLCWHCSKIPWVFILWLLSVSSSSCHVVKFISLPSKSDQKNHPSLAWLLTESPVVIIQKWKHLSKNRSRSAPGKGQGERKWWRGGVQNVWAVAVLLK